MLCCFYFNLHVLFVVAVAFFAISSTLALQKAATGGVVQGDVEKGGGKASKPQA